MSVKFQNSKVPFVSIVIPALNEQLTIGEFVDWCFAGIKQAGINGQILIIDSSTDNTAQIAKEHGAEVIQVPKRGLGRAYIDAIPYIKSQYVIMGDCDLTYDFREINKFIDKFREGFEFIMGSRFKGYIESNSMPPLHQYFGTPITTCILNIIYGTHYSDIHCGMRGISLEALKKMNLQSQSWEYASEMVLKAAKLQLKITEVPVRFYKDREGRLSHHKRSGWTSSWKAGWINLKAMFLYAPEFFLNKPGWFLFIFGFLLSTSLVQGPYNVGDVQLNLHWMLLGITITTLGYNAIQLGVLSQIYYQFNPAYSKHLKRLITYNGGVITAAGLFMMGFIINIVLFINWIRSDLRLSEFYHPGLWGLLLIILGFQTFTFTLLFLMIGKQDG